MQDYRCYIDGRWCDASDGARTEVEDPASWEVFASVPTCTAADVDRALASSAAAQPAWAALPAVRRAEYLHELCRRLEGERDHFARLLVREQGKRRDEAGAEVDDTVRYLRYAAEAARRIEGSILPADNPRERLWIHKVPYGVTVGMCAYNYPLALIGRKLGPALVTGNTMVLKPHEETPVTAAEFCRLVHEAGLPPGVVNLVTGDGATVGHGLAADERTRLISVTGSIRAGQAIAAAAAPNIAALSLELGGKASFIVLDDADLDAAAEAATVARFANAGQVCICSEAILVQDGVADAFTDRLMARVRDVRAGNPMDDAGIGPVTTRGARERIGRIVADSVAAGAEVLAGGGAPEGAAFERGNWYAPTVLAGPLKGTRSVTEEIFGPVLPIVRVADLDEAIAITNARDDGLSAYLWTRDHARFLDAIDRLQVGTVFVNKGITGYVQGYHNGHKRSGLGGEDGTHGIEGYLQKRTVYLAY